METVTVRGSESRLLRLPEVVQRTGLSRATIYNLIRDGNFPRPVKLTERLSRWPDDVVDDWLAARRAAVTQ